MSNDKENAKATKTSAWHRLHNKQHKKVNGNPRIGKLLTLFAEEDHRRIAMLIQKWLAEDERRKG